MAVTHSSTTRWRIFPIAPSLLFFTIFISLPFGTLLLYAIGNDSESWQHIKQYLLLASVRQTLLLVMLVVCFAFVLGVTAAIVIAFFDFPGRQLFRFIFMLPLAIPPYILAFVTASAHDVVPLPFFDSPLIGTSLVLGIAFFPYLYLLCLLHFENQSSTLLAAARLLGKTTLGAFFSVVLPAARPAIVAGLSIIIMDTVAEFGAPSLLGLQTITVVIMRVWSGMGDFNTALQLSGYLFLCVFCVFVLEQYVRNKATNSQTRMSHAEKTVRFRIKHAWCISLCCLLVTGAIIGTPVIMLASLAVEYVRNIALMQLWDIIYALFSSVSLAFVSVVWLVISALLVSYGVRHHKNTYGYLLRFITMGYAVPGVVIAMGLFIPFTKADGLLADFWFALFGQAMPFALTSEFVMLTYAYMVRFFASAFHPIQTRLMQVSLGMDEAAATFGVAKKSYFKRVHIPLIADGILVACVIVFIEVIKELPMTLILRPFNMTTLAVQVYELAADERLEQAALPSLLILLLSCSCAFLLYRIRYARSL